MPDYGTVAGVIELYPRIGSVTSITSAIIASYVGRAEGRMNGQLANRYTIPVSGSPPVLKDIAETWATGLILRRFFTQEKENTSEWVQSWIDDAKDTLEPFAMGSASLVASNGTRLVADLAAQGPWSSTSQYKPTFDVREMIRQRTDPDRVDAEEDKDT